MLKISKIKFKLKIIPFLSGGLKLISPDPEADDIPMCPRAYLLHEVTGLEKNKNLATGVDHRYL